MEDVASRYAAALVSIAKDENKLVDYKIAVLAMRYVLDTNPKLLNYLKSYFVKDEEKGKMVEELTRFFELTNFTNFLKVLCVRHKIFHYRDIFKETIKELNYELDILEGTVYSVERLPGSKILEISQAISKKLNKKIELMNKIDPRLIGGVKVVVHDYVFDGSIKCKLETMKEELKERRNG